MFLWDDSRGRRHLTIKKKPSLDAIGEIIVTENDVTY